MIEPESAQKAGVASAARMATARSAVIRYSTPFPDMQSHRHFSSPFRSVASVTAEHHALFNGPWPIALPCRSNRERSKWRQEQPRESFAHDEIAA